MRCNARKERSLLETNKKYAQKLSKLLVLGAFLCLLTSSSSLHDFHFSMGELEYNAESKSLEISLKLFTDDLEEAALKELHLDLGSIDKQNPLKGDSIVELYLKRHFAARSNSKELPITYIGREKEDIQTTTWCYLEVKVPRKAKTIVVTNSLLMPTFSDQRNRLQCKLPHTSKQQTLVFKKESIYDTLHLD